MALPIRGEYLRQGYGRALRGPKEDARCEGRGEAGVKAAVAQAQRPGKWRVERKDYAKGGAWR